MSRQRQQNPHVIYIPGDLQKKLEDISNYPMTIIEAPSGVGKTTALKQFFNTSAFSSTPTHWVTYLGEPMELYWPLVCEAISHIDLETASRLRALRVPCYGDFPRISHIVADIHCKEDTYLILDNFGDLALPLAESCLYELALQGCPRLHIVVVTTQIPGSSYSLMQSSSILRLSAQDFRFSLADVTAYYRAAGLRICESELDKIYQRTDGWAAALYLQLLSYLESGQFDQAGLESLLDHSLWNRLSPEAQHFFLTISVVPRFTLSQAVHMTGVDFQTAWLLLGSNGFVHYEPERKLYHFHSIFASSLAVRFSALPTEEQRKIILQAAQWAAQDGKLQQALQFYYRAAAYEDFLSTIVTSYDVFDIMDEHFEEMVLGMLDNTPQELLVRHPRAMIILVLQLFFTARADELAQRIPQVEQIISICTADEGEKNALWGELEFLRAFTEYNQINAMSAHHRRALELLESPATLISIKSAWTLGSPSVLHLFLRQAGTLDATLDQMDACMPFYYQLTGGHGKGAEIIMRAEAALLQGELDEAEVLCHRGMFAAESRRQSSVYQSGLFLLARLAVLRADRTLWDDIRSDVEKRGLHNAEGLCRHTQDLILSFWGITLGQEDLVVSWIASGDIDRQLVPRSISFAHIIHGRCLLEQKAYRQLLGAGAHYLDFAKDMCTLIPQIYTLIYMAVAHYKLGNPREAAQHLSEAMSLAFPDRLYLPFAENRKALAPLLEGIVVMDKAALAAISSLADRLEDGAHALSPSGDLLTGREREIALLAKEGLTSRKIGERLFLSESTVRNTLVRVYEKLDIHSRSELLETPL